MRTMITQGRDTLIKGGLIKRNRSMNTSARRIVVPTWVEEKPKEKGSTPEESRVETGRNQEKAGVASKG
jgi:hypothetical protein